MGRSAGRIADSSGPVVRSDTPPYPAVRRIERYGARLHKCRFAAMCSAGDTKEFCDVYTGRMLDTAVRAWIKWCCLGLNAVRQVRFSLPGHI